MLLTAFFFVPLAENGLQGAAQSQRQVWGDLCNMTPLGADTLLLREAMDHGEQWNRALLACAGGLGLLPEPPRPGVTRLPAYLPVFIRHLLVRVGTHAPPKEVPWAA
ncbi:MAG TPA: hypothetical protein PKE04_11670 [Clostridia bacterium]|nr:hypothetical protein [Clostridia bacterium]